MSVVLAPADPDVRLDDARILAAGLLERLAREQRAAGDYSRTFGHEHPQHAEALTTTRGEAARATKALYLAISDIDTAEAYDSADVVRDQTERMRGTASVPSDTLDAWAKALRSAT